MTSVVQPALVDVDNAVASFEHWQNLQRVLLSHDERPLKVALYWHSLCHSVAHMQLFPEDFSHEPEVDFESFLLLDSQLYLFSSDDRQTCLQSILSDFTNCISLVLVELFSCKSSGSLSGFLTASLQSLPTSCGSILNF